MGKDIKRKSIFRSLFVPMIFIMILQALLFYSAAVYGGIEESLTKNAADILSERLYNRKNEIETRFNNRWTDLDNCIATLNNSYSQYENKYGTKPLVADNNRQIAFLKENSADLISTLRHTETNGIFLILNNAAEQANTFPETGEQKYGLCLRDMDQESNYSGTEDLLLERSPSSIIDSLGCSLDSWWEAFYSFTSEADGDYYYAPLNAAWKGLSTKSADLAYFSDIHQISGSDPQVVSYSVPLLAADGFPYAVLGIELSAQYLASLLPHKELNSADNCCYVLALQEAGSDTYEPLVSTGPLYSRCFGDESVISAGETASTGGFTCTGRDGTELYGTVAELKIYNNNSPFENRHLVLLAIVDSKSLFAYIGQIKANLLAVSLFSLLLGILMLTIVSRRFAAPITTLARRVRSMDEDKINQYQDGYQLDHLGITEIDQLVDSIEELNRNVSRNSARTEFFSRMSHDMRTPMNAIISFSSPEMLENADEAVKTDYLDKIHGSGLYLLGLINEVLDMTKIENNKTELHLTAVRAAQLFNTTIPIIEKLAQKKKIAFTADLRIAPELWVMADKQHLNQIVMNLLSNAVKFTPEGGTVRLTAEMITRPKDSISATNSINKADNAGTTDSVRPKDSISTTNSINKTDSINKTGSAALTDKDSPASQICRFIVTDTGIGMSPEFIKKLYTPFEQESSSHEGTGLGLTIAKKLVELMNGTIDCQSTKNVGTTFTVTLPLAPADAPASFTQQQEPGTTSANSLASLQGKRVLICEDNAINVIIITQLLQRVGLSVDAAVNGANGVERFNTSELLTYSAILMDIRMPVMNGLEATRAIRALPRADAASVPIIAMTANAFDEDVAISLTAGMNEHLSKPVEPQILYATLLKYIG